MNATGKVTLNTVGGFGFGKTLRQTALAALMTIFILIIANSTANASSRIKDIVDFQGVRDNLLVGYGLVVGLNGTGDTLADGHFTQQSLIAMRNRRGVKPTASGVSSSNVAAVMGTAALPAFARLAGAHAAGAGCARAGPHCGTQ